MDFEKFILLERSMQPVPFWSINDLITPDEAARQLSDMIDVGFAGGFFHSRAGLVTEYLGDDWFASINAALKAAEEKDGLVWLYDEDLWPSGGAGGGVSSVKDDYRAASLQAEFVAAGSRPQPDGYDIPKAAYIIHGRTGVEVERIESADFETACDETNLERLLFRCHYDPKTSWFAGESYANLLNPEAVQEFIRHTHEIYRCRLGKDFGGLIPGIFTDEPQLSQGPSSIPWWDGIPDVYADWHGRDLWEDLPYLFFNGGDSRKIRLLVHRTLLRQFSESYSRQIFDWCGSHGLTLTGHYNGEDGFEGQIRNHCGGVMAHYRFQQMPGIDHLCRQIDGMPRTMLQNGERVTGMQDGMLLTMRQVTSAARQLGQERVLTEIFGASRHTNTFEDFKWLSDYDLVHGANFFCPHLIWQSMRGRRKRDFPPNLGYQQTYFDDLKALNEYISRMCAVLSSGSAKPDVLILHSIESGTAGHRLGFQPAKGVGRTVYMYTAPGRTQPALFDLPPEDLSAANYCGRMLYRILDATLNAGYDCDLGDDGYIEDIGSLEGSLFRVGKMTYPVVVIPPSQTWRPKTYTLLQEFVAGGGRLIILGSIPTELDCEEAADRWRELARMPGVECVPCSMRQIQDALDRALPSTQRLRDPNGNPVAKSYIHHRIDDDQEIFFIVNSDRDRAHDYEFTIPGKAGIPVAVWNPLDGTRYQLGCESTGSDLMCTFSLPPAGSVLLVLGDADAPIVESSTSGCPRELCTPRDWQFSRSEPNVLVMDRISVSLDAGKSWSTDDLEFRVRGRLAEHFGLTDVRAWQPWAWIKKDAPSDGSKDVILRYSFRSAIDRPASAFLVAEDLHKARVYVNGFKVDTSNAGWHWDRTFGKVEITDWLKRGVNAVDLHLSYDFLTEVESAYIVGDFAVSLADPLSPEIINEPASLTYGSWAPQGYPFYSGRMTYKTVFDLPEDGSVLLRLIRPSAVLCNVKVNSHSTGRIMWRPYQLDLTPLVTPGKNTLEIEVVPSRQNTHGPLHEREGDDSLWCGPECFEADYLVREDYSLYDYGLIGGVRLIHHRKDVHDER